MTPWFLQWAGLSALAPVVGLLGLGFSITAAAIAVAVFIPALRRIALPVALAAGVATIVYGKGVHDGSAIKQAAWDAAEQRAIQRGDDARKASERDIARKPVGRLRDDIYDRDNH